MLDLLRQSFWQPCLLCEQPQKQLSLICEPCQLDLPWLPSGCTQCALPWRYHPSQSPCRQPGWLINNCRATLAYHFPVPQLIHQFKQQASLTTGRALGLCLTQNTHFTGTAIDALIPVPSSRQTLRSRGFNPAKILADTIGHALGIPVMTNWVIKTGITKAQKYRSRAERLTVSENPFQAKKPCTAKRIAIIDDVITTMTTAIQVAEPLKAQGVQHIEIWAPCRTLPKLTTLVSPSHSPIEMR